MRASQSELQGPSPPYVEKLRFDPVRIETRPKTYILCTESEFIDVTRVANHRIDAAKRGWTYVELPSSHVPMADLPNKLDRLLLDAARG